MTTMLAWCRGSAVALVCAIAMAGCDGSAPLADAGSLPETDGGSASDGSAALPAQMCAPECTTPVPPLPGGYDPVTTCYDGCNWCTCTADGPVNCTARDCSVLDAGGADGGV